ncbi:hypothetical protein [Tenacibaculum maritimum]|uniref:hypothetical protein n=1 Tax=Tenacibaculum maritimum TaxID=107401 RepID=UPI003877A613
MCLKIFVLIFILSCQQGLIKLERDDFSIHYPFGLILDESGKEGTLFILKTEKENSEDVFIENINLVKANIGNLSFDDLRTKTIRDVKKIANVLEDDKIKVNGNDCLRIIFELSEQGQKMKVMQHFIIKKEKIYVLTFTSESKNYETYFNAMNETLLSFKLK